ncbi:MAG: iron-sulfur cluster assembly accessory protein [Gammaproteobacteria bacterium]
MSEAAFSREIVDSEIKMSPSAAAQMKGLMENAEDNIEGIRVFVSGGGCGGMTYGMTYTDTVQPYDKVLQGDGFKVLVDAVALGYLKGSDIDFVDNGVNASFVFNNVFKSVGGSGGCGGCGSSSGGGCA